MAEYTNAIQQKFLQGDEEEATPKPSVTPAAITANSFQVVQIARVGHPVPIAVNNMVEPGLPADAGLPIGEARVNLDADLDALFAWPCTFFFLDA